MATFYYNGFGEVATPNWQTLGKWWMAYNAETATFSVPAVALPTSEDDVVVYVSDQQVINTGSQPTVSNLAVYGEFGDAGLKMSITVTGHATFNSASFFNPGTLTGNVTFNDGLLTQDGYDTSGYPVIDGDATFNGYANIYIGDILGNATLNDSAYNVGQVFQNATFNGVSLNDGIVYGDATFNDSAYNWDDGYVEGAAVFNDSSYNAGVYGAAPASEVYQNRTPYPIPRGIGGTNILGMT